ncbi:MAG: NADH:ubiquinone oxidoreductase subunit J [Catenulispora sp.]|nr:NADH:ubiquinone oxidoreductase subunit J [Catenulispora sp.]
MFVDIAFWVLSVGSVLSGAAVFWVDSMARATYALAISFVTVGIVVVLLHQDYVGLVTVVMMVMEMAVMAVYMVMYMGMNPALMPMSMVHSRRTALIASVSAFVVLGSGAVLVPWPARRSASTADTTRALGAELMGPKMLVMAGVGAAMVATIVAGVVLAAARGRYDRYGDDLDRSPADDPQPGGVGR